MMQDLSGARRDAMLVVALALIVGMCAAEGALAAKPTISGPVLAQISAKPDEWFKSDEGVRAAENIVSWQNENGGWWKFYDPKIPRPAQLPPSGDDDGVPGDTEAQWRRTSTFDNGATYTEMRILARAHRITGKESYAKSFKRGLKFIFDAQYENGGWPQRFPVEDTYGRHITFNDDAMTNVVILLRDIAERKTDFEWIPEQDRQHCLRAYLRGIDCILRCQIKVNGKLTGWCQQHDAKTLAPTWGRTYEPPSISGGESADIAMVLMHIENPDSRVRDAIEGVHAWYRGSMIKGKRYEKVEGPQYENGRDRILVDDPNAPPLWARFYDIETNTPILMGRDGVVRQTLTELPWERRALYAWYGQAGARVIEEYPKWKARVREAAAVTGAAKKITVAKEGGDFTTVQAAIDSIPQGNTEPTVIAIQPGTYKERIVVPRGKQFVTLIGEDADAKKTVLTYDLVASFVPPGTTQPIGTSGTPSTSIDADDFTARNITFENTAGDRGQAVAVKVVGDRVAFYNCRFLGWQDTLYADAGRQYYRDCHIEGRVDFIFGGATAVFDRCFITTRNGGYVTAARTMPDQPFGFVFLDCAVASDGPQPAYLGRPWQWDRGRNAMVAFIRTRMGPYIRAEGWNKWDRPNNPNTDPGKTCRYREFASVDFEGRPIDVSKRVEWSRQMHSVEAAKFTVANILGGEDHWDPSASGEKP
jgi:pectinesterase